IADAVGGAWGYVRRIILDAEEELWTNQNPLQCNADATLEPFLASSYSVHIKQGREIFLVNGPAVGTTSEIGNNFLGTSIFVGGVKRNQFYGRALAGACRIADEDLAPAGRVSHTFRVVGTIDIDALQPRFGILPAAMRINATAPKGTFWLSSVLYEEGYFDGVRPSLDREAHL